VHTTASLAPTGIELRLVPVPEATVVDPFLHSIEEL
jgi:hypothetical protein